MSAERTFDLILFGATGFTGRLVAEYLTRRAAGTPLRWALAGRNRERLERVRGELAAIDAAAAEIAIVTGDAHDEAAMTRLARDATAVCTTVGPYLQHGAALVAACAAAGTHYCDLTGEVPFIKASIDRNHERAVASGARVVHCCGFDSVPSDLGVLVAQRALADKVGQGAGAIHALFELRGAFSGGTIASLLGVIDAARDREVRRVLGNPYALDPPGLPRGPDRDDARPGYDRVLGKITAPFVMAAINTRIVRRSHALQGRPWGDGFSYDERMALPASARGAAFALGITAAMAGLVAGSQIGFVRRALDARLPKPGEGPSEEDRARGRYTVRFHGEAGGARVVATFADRLDPGYSGTAKLLGEAALALAQDELPGGGGVLTPATALGSLLVERLRAADVTITADVT